MTISSNTKTILIASAGFIVLAIILTMGLQRYQKTDAAKVIRLNQLAYFDSGKAAICKDIKNNNHNISDVHLFVGGIDTGLSAAGCQEQTSSISVMFRHIKPTRINDEQDLAVWSKILGHPLLTMENGREIDYELRWKKIPENSITGKTTLQIFDLWAPSALAFVLWVWFLLGFLGAKTALLRDPAPPDTPLHRRAFSLAKTQMAWWFAIIFAAFVFLWIVTGATPSLSAQALILLGISTVTTIAANGVTSSVSAEGAQGKFFIDLLSDAHGVAVHRFQMLVMTVTLGLLFLFDALTRLTMPEFDPSLLTLMGISASAYVTLKIPEQRADSVAAGNAVQPVAVPDPKNAYTPTP